MAAAVHDPPIVPPRREAINGVDLTEWHMRIFRMFRAAKTPFWNILDDTLTGDF
jgi:hypothetical protein